MRVVLCVDAETLSYFSPGPWQSTKEKVKWWLNKQLWGIRYAEGYDGLKNLLDVSGEHSIPMTIFAVEEIRRFLELNHSKYPDNEIGSHSYSHKCLLTMTDKELEKEFKNISPCTSFAAPMNMIEDSNNPDRVYKHMVKKGIKIFRYQGPDDVHFKKGRHCDMITWVGGKHKHGLKYVWGTKYFEGTSSKTHIQEVIQNLEENHYLPDDHIYCLSTHDFTWRKEQMWKIIKVLDYLQSHFKVLTLKELAEEK